MKRRVRANEDLARAAGLWLRCFLGAAIWIVVLWPAPTSLNAQIDVPGPERLSHVDGYVVNPVGRR